MSTIEERFMRLTKGRSTRNTTFMNLLILKLWEGKYSM